MAEPRTWPTESEKLACYCTCGASLTGRASKPDALIAAFNQNHTGDGHKPTDAAGARAARRREDRRLAKEESR